VPRDGSNVWMSRETLARLTEIQNALKEERGLVYPRTIVIMEALAFYQRWLLSMSQAAKLQAEPVGDA
jgi:hypothetical protein